MSFPFVTHGSCLVDELSLSFSVQILHGLCRTLSPFLFPLVSYSSWRSVDPFKMNFSYSLFSAIPREPVSPLTSSPPFPRFLMRLLPSPRPGRLAGLRFPTLFVLFQSCCRRFMASCTRKTHTQTPPHPNPTHKQRELLSFSRSLSF